MTDTYCMQVRSRRLSRRGTVRASIPVSQLPVQPVDQLKGKRRAWFRESPVPDEPAVARAVHGRSCTIGTPETSMENLVPRSTDATAR